MQNTFRVELHFTRNGDIMIDEEISKLRDKLNQSIIDKKDYNIIYKLSIELDELIAQYYSKNMKIQK